MGAVTFSIDQTLIEILKSTLPLDIFVETGTFEGEAIEKIKKYFKKIYSIELSNDYYQNAVLKFKNDAHISILHDDSANALCNLKNQLINNPVVFWLDAHWCVANKTAGELSQCPLLHELEAIETLHPDSVILIDDARLFLAPPPSPHEISQWPSFDDILSKLNKLSSSHTLIIVNDCIVFTPQKIRPVIQQYAYQSGIDWLTVLDKSRNHDKMLEQLKEAANEIKVLETEIESNKNDIDCLTKENEILRSEIETLRKASSLRLELINRLHCELNTNINIEITQRLLDRLNSLLHAIEKFYIQVDDKIISNISRPETQSDELKKINSLLKKSINELQEKYKKICAEYHRDLIHSYQHKSFKGRIQRFKTLLKSAIMPKLGTLLHYPPQSIDIPKHYHKKIQCEEFPLISIITPAFNQGTFLERTIKSIIEQHYPHLEYIIQDGGSDDTTLEILERYQNHLKHWESIGDGGQSNALNIGFARTTGDILAYLNSDDILLPGSLHYVGRYFATHPEVDVVYGHRILINENDQEIGRWVLPPHDTDILSWADYIPQETLFWRRRIWEKVGGKIDESYRFAMDWDLILRFRDAGAKFARLPRFIGAFRIHPDQKTSAHLTNTGMNEMQRLRERCHKRTVSMKEINAAIRPYLYRHLIYHRLYRAGILRY